MGFGEAIRTCFRKYVDFSGRARRSEYWWFVLFQFLVFLVTEIIDAAGTGGVITGLAALGLLLPSIGVTVRRLHDTDRSGWWILAPAAPAFVSGVFFAMGSSVIMAIFGILALILDVVVLIFLIARGTAGANQYGPDPLA